MFGRTTKTLEILEINNNIITDMIEYLKKTDMYLKQINKAQDDIHEMLMDICGLLNIGETKDNRTNNARGPDGEGG